MRHDKYVKDLLVVVAGKRFKKDGNEVRVDYAGGITARIDGVVDGCAIEIESRVNKQIRGAILDLLQHRFSKKLLIIVPAHMPDPKATAEHCEDILNKYKKQDDHTRVIVLKGTGEEPKEEDKEIIEKALGELGVINKEEDQRRP